MRTFRDDDGVEWDVVLGRASWGVFQALFLPRNGDAHEIRSAVLPDESRQKAARTLQTLERDALQKLLAGAKPGGSGEGKGLDR